MRPHRGSSATDHDRNLDQRRYGDRVEFTKLLPLGSDDVVGVTQRSLNTLGEEQLQMLAFGVLDGLRVGGPDAGAEVVHSDVECRAVEDILRVV